MSGAALAIFALTLLVAAGSPGPTVAALVARILANGFRDVLPFLVALWLGEVVWLSLTVAGLAVVAQSFAIAFLVLKYLGVAYLLYLAWGMWHAPLEPSRVISTRQGPWRMFSAGLLVSLGNPKNMVFYLALLPTLIDLGHIGPIAWLQLVATMLVVLAAVDLAWSAAAVQARRLFVDGRGPRIANKISATIMAGTAAAIAAR